MITTTLEKIRKNVPSKHIRWKRLLKSLNKTEADDAPLKFSDIVASNGVDEALYCLFSIWPEYKKEVRLFCADCAESVLHIFEEKYPEDKRPRLAIEAARKFANGKINKATLNAAGEAAWASVAINTKNFILSGYTDSSYAGRAVAAAARCTNMVDEMAANKDILETMSMANEMVIDKNIKFRNFISLIRAVATENRFLKDADWKAFCATHRKIFIKRFS